MAPRLASLRNLRMAVFLHFSAIESDVGYEVLLAALEITIRTSLQIQDLNSLNIASRASNWKSFMQHLQHTWDSLWGRIADNIVGLQHLQHISPCEYILEESCTPRAPKLQNPKPNASELTLYPESLNP